MGIYTWIFSTSNIASFTVILESYLYGQSGTSLVSLIHSPYLPIFFLTPLLLNHSIQVVRFLQSSQGFEQKCHSRFFFNSWSAKAHSCVITESCLFPGADVPHSECAAPGQLGVGTGNRVGALAKYVASCFIECVLICPTFCTGSCCQWVNQVDGWPRLEVRGRWLKEGCGEGV